MENNILQMPIFVSEIDTIQSSATTRIQQKWIEFEEINKVSRLYIEMRSILLDYAKDNPTAVDVDLSKYSADLCFHLKNVDYEWLIADIAAMGLSLLSYTQTKHENGRIADIKVSWDPQDRARFFDDRSLVGYCFEWVDNPYESFQQILLPNGKVWNETANQRVVVLAYSEQSACEFMQMRFGGKRQVAKEWPIYNIEVDVAMMYTMEYKQKLQP